MTTFSSRLLIYFHSEVLPSMPSFQTLQEPLMHWGGLTIHPVADPGVDPYGAKEPPPSSSGPGLDLVLRSTDMIGRDGTTSLPCSG